MDSYSIKLEMRIEELEENFSTKLKEELIKYDMIVNIMMGADEEYQRIWSTQNVEEYLNENKNPYTLKEYIENKFIEIEVTEAYSLFVAKSSGGHFTLDQVKAMYEVYCVNF